VGSLPFAHPLRAKRPVTDGGVANNDRNKNDDDQEPTPDSSLSDAALASVMIGKIKEGTVQVTRAEQTTYWRKSSQRDLIIRTAKLLGEDVIQHAIFVM